MKKTIISSIALLGVSLASIAHAETVDPRDARIEIRKDMAEKRAEMRDTAREIRDEAKTATTTEARLSIIKRMVEAKNKAGQERANHLVGRFEHKISMMNDLAKRIEDRLAELKAHGKDVTEAEVKLADARIVVATAVTKTTELKTALTAILSNTSTTTPTNDALKTLKPQIRETEDAIRNAEKALHKAMQARIIRPAKQVSETATSTTATTTATTTTN